MTAKHFSQSASSARRTATMIADLARYCSDEADRGVLLAASRITARMADDYKQRAVVEKRKEDAYAKRHADAMRLAAAIRWPNVTVLQRVAFVTLVGTGYMLRNLFDYLSNPGVRTAEQRLANHFTDATREMADEIAHAVAKNSTSVEAEAALRQTKLVAHSQDTRVIELATAVESLIESQRTKAAA